ncbi:MAG TPA: nucleotide exchange factor GrpE [Xanthobacteraceae bacterium]|jgi:molecular chaperone GrpE|nr:nucleotide exchange factor GrpE [Xanthobacteraceae bacterium]
MTDTPARTGTEPMEQEGMSPSPNPEQTPDAASEDPTAALAKEAAQLKDRLLRALAEMENLRRRTEKEVADARLYGISSFARDMLGVADNMRRALDTIGPDLRESADTGIKSLLEGIDLTERELLKVLDKHGVKKLEPQGAKFDPNLHQAMYEVPDPSVPSGTVVQVVQSGYTIGERILRPAMVAVARGGPKGSAAQADNNSRSAEASKDASVDQS